MLTECPSSSATPRREEIGRLVGEEEEEEGGGEEEGEGEGGDLAEEREDMAEEREDLAEEAEGEAEVSGSSLYNVDIHTNANAEVFLIVVFFSILLNEILWLFTFEICQPLCKCSGTCDHTNVHVFVCGSLKRLKQSVTLPTGRPCHAVSLRSSG